MGLDLDHVKKLSPGWFSAIAGAAAAGAVLVPNHRLLAGLAAGGAMLFIALKLTPCCAGCAAGKGCGGTAPTANPFPGVAPGEPNPNAPGPEAPPVVKPNKPLLPPVRELFRDSAIARCAGCS